MSHTPRAYKGSKKLGNAGLCNHPVAQHAQHAGVSCWAAIPDTQRVPDTQGITTQRHSTHARQLAKHAQEKAIEPGITQMMTMHPVGMESCDHKDAVAGHNNS